METKDFPVTSLREALSPTNNCKLQSLLGFSSVGRNWCLILRTRLAELVWCCGRGPKPLPHFKLRATRIDSTVDSKTDKRSYLLGKPPTSFIKLYYVGIDTSDHYVRCVLFPAHVHSTQHPFRNFGLPFTRQSAITRQEMGNASASQLCGFCRFYGLTFHTSYLLCIRRIICSTVWSTYSIFSTILGTLWGGDYNCPNPNLISSTNARKYIFKQVLTFPYLSVPKLVVPQMTLIYRLCATSHFRWHWIL